MYMSGLRIALHVLDTLTLESFQAALEVSVRAGSSGVSAFPIPTGCAPKLIRCIPYVALWLGRHSWPSVGLFLEAVQRPSASLSRGVRKALLERQHVTHGAAFDAPLVKC